MTFRDKSEHRIVRTVRSTTSLVIIAVALGVAVAAVLGGAVWLLTAALHHAATA